MPSIHFCVYDGANLLAVLFAIETSQSIVGTSTNTPTTVARAAPEFSPNKLMATATASSKKLELLISAAGAAILWGMCALHIHT